MAPPSLLSLSPLSLSLLSLSLSLTHSLTHSLTLSLSPLSLSPLSLSSLPLSTLLSVLRMAGTIRTTRTTKLLHTLCHCRRLRAIGRSQGTCVC